MVRSATQEEFDEFGKAPGDAGSPLFVHMHPNTKNSRIAILVHGLGGTRYKTWGNLPRFLFQDDPSYDLGLYDYASGLRRFKERTDSSLEARCQHLADTIRDLPHDQIILVGHSLGGLICKWAIKDLIDSQTKTATNNLALKRVSGLLLIATPQAGSLKVPAVLWRLSRDARALRAHSKFVSEIEKRFADRVVHDPAGRYRADRVYIPMRSIVAMNDSWVDSLSAALGLSRSEIKHIDASHTAVVKPASKDADAYQWILKSIQGFFLNEYVATGGDVSSQDLRVPQQLPQANEDFLLFGRSRFVSDAQTIISAPNSRHLLHIHGEPGVGKTTVAVRLARNIAAEFPDGNIYVDLRGGEGPALTLRDALTWCLASLDPDQPLPTSTEQLAAAYRTMLAHSRVVIVLDNAAEARQVDSLLPTGDSLAAVIVTSRRSLVSLHISPDRRLELLPLGADDSISMIADRWGRSFSPLEAGATSVLDFCQGLPFALDLVAAYLRTYQHIELKDLVLSFERQPIRGLTASQGTLSLAYGELSNHAQRLFLALAALGLGAVPSWISDAVCQELAVNQDALYELVDAKLLRVSRQRNVTRFIVHDLGIRFGRFVGYERADHTSVIAAAVKAHIQTLADLQHIVEPLRFSYARDRNLISDPLEHISESAAIAILESERLTTAAVAELASPADFIRMATTIPFCMVLQGTWSDWLSLQQRAIDLAEQLDDRLAIGYLLQSMQNILRILGRGDEALTASIRSVSTFNDIGEAIAAAYSSIDVGIGVLAQGRYDDGLKILRGSREFFGKDSYWRAIAAKELGAALVESDYAEEGIVELLLALDTFVELKDARWEAYTLINLGDAYRTQAMRESDVTQVRYLNMARDAYARHVRWATDHGEWRVATFSLFGLAAVECVSENYKGARLLVAEAIGKLSDVSDLRTKSFGRLLEAYIDQMEHKDQMAVARIDELLSDLLAIGDNRRIAFALLVRAVSLLRLGASSDRAFDVRDQSYVLRHLPAFAKDRSHLGDLRSYVPVAASWF